ncbi:MAG: hypothetical protein Q8K57_11030 [Thiobacillus sp.]|nr:hypothetical protein [Thiobacillus sp.]MDP3124777.1 hypothetical protein [Thiobacillus sp.]
MIEVLRAGLCDLVMDQGRPGYGALGVPAGGAADPLALATANRLVGNDRGAAGLEVTLTGPVLHFPAGAWWRWQARASAPPAAAERPCHGTPRWPWRRAKA